MAYLSIFRGTWLIPLPRPSHLYPPTKNPKGKNTIRNSEALAVLLITSFEARARFVVLSGVGSHMEKVRGGTASEAGAAPRGNNKGGIMLERESWHLVTVGKQEPTPLLVGLLLVILSFGSSIQR